VILAHEATGDFITHCEWNSVQESVAAGVPMIALPLQSDQPANALLLAKEAKEPSKYRSWLREHGLFQGPSLIPSACKKGRSKNEVSRV
jgi:cis-zeatin O-glucosyltransferase